jgi:Mrp family chromosome partitioning ATPase
LKGLIDVDVYGPSLPIIIKPNDPAVHKSPLGKGMVMPIEHEGLKMLSLGFVSPSVSYLYSHAHSSSVLTNKLTLDS